MNHRTGQLTWVEKGSKASALFIKLLPQRRLPGAAKILIDPFLSDDPSWDKGWIGSRAGEDSTRGGGR